MNQAVTFDKEKSSAIMTLQCLPEIIRQSLQTIIAERNFSLDALLSTTMKGNTGISSSCSVEVVENARKCYFFVKYLSCTQGDFSEEAVTYFTNEILFYEKIVPGFRKFLSTAECTSLAFAPGCLDVGNPSSDHPFIVMEDLVAKGYTPLDVRRPLSVTSALAILRQLGRFHALSFAMRDKHPCVFEKSTSQLRETIFRQETRSTLGKLFIHSIHDVLKLAKQSFPPDSVYVEKFATFALNIFEKMAALIEGEEEEAAFKVVTHSDLWPNNILSKSSGEDTKCFADVRFIDYQGCRLSSPVHDLQLFLLIGLDQTTRAQNRANLIGHYHTSLCESLQNLGCDPLRIFPFSALRSQLEKQSKFAMAVALAGLPLLFNEDSSTAPDISDRNGRTDNMDALFEFVRVVQTRKSMRCKNKMLEIVMDVVDEGYL